MKEKIQMFKLIDILKKKDYIKENKYFIFCFIFIFNVLFKKTIFNNINFLNLN